MSDPTITPTPNEPVAPTLQPSTLFSTDLIPETMKSEPFFQDFVGKPMETFLKSSLDTKKSWTDRVVLPKTDDADGITAFKSKMRPEKPEDYGFKVPDGTKWTETGLGQVAKLMHDVGTPSWMATELFNGWVALDKAGRTAQDEALKQADIAATGELQKFYGESYTESMGLFNRFIRAAGGDDLIKHFETLGINHDPMIAKAFITVAKTMKEDVWSGNAPASAPTINDLQTQIDSYYNQPSDGPFKSVNHADHKATKQHVERLIAQKIRQQDMVNAAA